MRVQQKCTSTKKCTRSAALLPLPSIGHCNSYYKGGPSARCCQDLLREGCTREGYAQLLGTFNNTIEAIDIPYEAMSLAQQGAFDVTCPERLPVWSGHAAAIYFISFRILSAFVVIKLMVGTNLVHCQTSQIGMSAVPNGWDSLIKFITISQ
jgi:hypothetical protein